MASKFPTSDVGPLFDAKSSKKQRQRAAKALSDACHRYGFVAITGHGISPELLGKAFATLKQLFALPHDEKTQAQPPAGAVPHRGYSAPGQETLLTKEQASEPGEEDGVVNELRNNHGATDSKAGLRVLVSRVIHLITSSQKSYEIGSESNKNQYNIWLPDNLLSDFQKFSLEFFWQLNKVGEVLLEAFATGLGLTEDERYYLTKGVRNGHNNQLRFLHYPPVPTEMTEREVIARMPAHTDWSLFTMLFQDDVGGLELQDPQHKGSYMKAESNNQALVLNIGDMLERITNGYFPSAVHRVTLPSPLSTHGMNGTSSKDHSSPARYSIPYFFAPDDDKIISTMKSCMKGDASNFADVRFDQYASLRASRSYINNESEKVSTK